MTGQLRIYSSRLFTIIAQTRLLRYGAMVITLLATIYVAGAVGAVLNGQPAKIRTQPSTRSSLKIPLKQTVNGYNVVSTNKHADKKTVEKPSDVKAKSLTAAASEAASSAISHQKAKPKLDFKTYGHTNSHDTRTVVRILDKGTLVLNLRHGEHLLNL